MSLKLKYLDDSAGPGRHEKKGDQKSGENSVSC
jgi:hypothetical protein